MIRSEQPVFWQTHRIIMALIGSVLTLFDTRLVLLLGAVLATWAGWRLQGWRGEMAAATLPRPQGQLP